MDEQKITAGSKDISKEARRSLARHAHSLQPVVMVGKQGVTQELVKACEQALVSHELIKVRFQNFKEECRALAEELAGQTSSVLVRVIGHVAILYREDADPARRRFPELH